MSKHNQISQTHSRLRGRDITPLVLSQQVSDAAVASLSDLGIRIDPAIVRHQVRSLIGDAAEQGQFKLGDSAFTPSITSPSIPTPLQFLQSWLPGFVKVITAARKIDTILGVKTVGSWEDQEIVQGVLEPAGSPTEYSDYGNVPLASWNVNFERRTIVRGELGIQVALLEEARASAMRLNSADEKRQGAAVMLEVLRNSIGFYGWNNGSNRTYGFLNDPNLPAALTSATSSGWAAGATFFQITSDIRTLIMTLRVQSNDQIDPEEVDLTLVLPMTVMEYLTVTTDFGISVRDWIKQTYPKMRIVSCPELAKSDVNNTALGTAVLFADEIDSEIDGSSDGGEVFAQLIQTKFMTLGVEKRVKSYVEDYANATAGVLLKRPYAVVRMIGV